MQQRGQLKFFAPMPSRERKPPHASRMTVECRCFSWFIPVCYHLHKIPSCWLLT
jgi:hypothetical protein